MAPSRQPALARRRRRLRDRRGRGLRGQLAAPDVPLSRTRAERFDDLVLEAVEHLERRWGEQLAGVEFVVDEVPPEELEPAEPDLDPVPLSRLLPPRGTGRSSAPPQIVLYRRPIELRAADHDDLADLVLDVVVHEVAHLLGVEPDVIDPEGHGEEPED